LNALNELDNVKSINNEAVAIPHIQ
jgi:hypothetical protein